MVSTESNIIHRISRDSATEAGYYRLLKNEQVSLPQMIGHITSKLSERVVNKHVLILGDSSEISLKDCLGYIRDADRIGVLSDNKTPGFHLHTSMCIDAETGHGLGLSDLILWNRGKRVESKRTRDKKRKSLPWLSRESYKWYLGIKNSLELVTKAKQVSFVFDADADFIELWKRIYQLQIHAIIRLKHNKRLIGLDSAAELPKLKDYVETLSWYEQSYSLKIGELNRKNYSRAIHQKRAARLAKIKIRYAPVKLLRLVNYPQPLYIIQAKEAPCTVPNGEEPIDWLILSTHPVDSFGKAYQIIQWYCLRWMIEQLFRLSKKQGFRIEQTRLEYLDSILKQTTATMDAAFQVMQLLLARNNPGERKTEEIFSKKEIQCLKALNKKYQGKTEKQKNPYPSSDLSWAVWVIARLGGWKGYQKARPPGPIRLKRGLERFYTIFEGWIIHQDKDLC